MRLPAAPPPPAPTIYAIGERVAAAAHVGCAAATTARGRRAWRCWRGSTTVESTRDARGAAAADVDVEHLCGRHRELSRRVSTETADDALRVRVALRSPRLERDRRDAAGNRERRHRARVCEVTEPVHVTPTLVTFALATVPVPFCTVHVTPAGCVRMVTAYGLPSAIFVANVNAPLSVSARLSAPLSWRTSVLPVGSPMTVPPIENVLVVHATATFVILLRAWIFRSRSSLTHVCVGVVGCVFTVTA